MNKEIYGFPGGHINLKENPLNAAKRELIEETGYKGKNWKNYYPTSIVEHIIVDMSMYMLQN